MKFYLKVILSGIILTLSAYGTMAQTGMYQEETAFRKTPEPQRFLLCGSPENPIRIAGYMNYPPFGWKEIEPGTENRPIITYFGIGPELFKKFAKEYNLRYTYTNILNYNEAKYALSRGYVDVLLGNYFEANPYSNMAYFFPGYLSNPIVIVSLKPEEGKTMPQTLEDLKGKKGFVRGEENLYDMLYRQLPPGVTLSKVNGASRAFQALLRKEVDFLLMSQYAYETEVRRFKIGDFVTYSEKPITSPVIFMSYAVGNECAAFIKPALEAKLKEYSADEKLLRGTLTKQLIAWENKFINEKSLMFATETIQEEKEESAPNLDEWLKSQEKGQKKDENVAQKGASSASVSINATSASEPVSSTRATTESTPIANATTAPVSSKDVTTAPDSAVTSSAVATTVPAKKTP